MDKYLIFFAADRAFGLDAEHIRAVGMPLEPVRVPGVPDYVRGIVSRGGRMIPLIDLRMRLNAAPPVNERRRGIIYVETDGEPAGIIVDYIGDMVTGAEVPETARIIAVEDIVKKDGAIY